MRCSNIVTTGLSRRSSVSSLNANPMTPMRFAGMSITASMLRLRCWSLLGRADSNRGSVKSMRPARYTRARRSLGKQEPPKAKPGFKYADDTLSFTSAHSVAITSSPFTPNRSLRAPISFAKAIFMAWNALQAYFIISAVRSETRQGFTPNGAYSAARRWTAFASAPPTTSNEGSIKSLTAAPSRRNSGLETTLTFGNRDRTGMTTSSHVPGNTVLRMATVSGLVRDGSKWAISSITRRSCVRPRLPFLSEGVPTQMKAASARSIPAWAEALADSRPSSTFLRTSSSRPGS